jgi:hypothetical protein
VSVKRNGIEAAALITESGLYFVENNSVSKI